MAKALGVLLFMAALGLPQSAKEVTYEVDGTATYATLTTINQNGGTEQNQVKLPFAVTFYARGGQPVYLSAQKTRVATTYRGREFVTYDGVTGTVHVLIRVTGAVLQEATSSAPYRIATAKCTLLD
jgi:hypothetical protein